MQESDTRRPVHSSDGLVPAAAKLNDDRTSWRIPDRIRQQIINTIRQHPSWGRRKLSEMFGVSETVIRTVRNEAKIPPNPAGGARGGRAFFGCSCLELSRLKHWPFRPSNPRPLNWAK